MHYLPSTLTPAYSTHPLSSSPSHQPPPQISWTCCQWSMLPLSNSDLPSCSDFPGRHRANNRHTFYCGVASCICILSLNIEAKFHSQMPCSCPADANHMTTPTARCGEKWLGILIRDHADISRPVLPRFEVRCLLHLGGMPSKVNEPHQLRFEIKVLLLLRFHPGPHHQPEFEISGCLLGGLPSKVIERQLHGAIWF